MVRHFASVVLGLAVVVAAAESRADSAPALVIPGKRGVAVIINNYNATWAAVEGDWGLYRPGHMAPTVIGGHFIGGAREPLRRNRYYPSSGQTPAQGRLEIEPPADRPLPPPAESFSRFWSSSAEPVPAAELPNSNSGMAPEVTPFNPPVIVAPQIGPSRHHH